MLEVVTGEGNLKTLETPIDRLAIQREQRLTPKYGVSYSKNEIVQENLIDISRNYEPLTAGAGREGWIRFVLLERFSIGFSQGDFWSAATGRNFSASRAKSGDQSPHSIGHTQLKTAIEVSNEQIKDIKAITLRVIDALDNRHIITINKDEWKTSGKL